MMFALKTTTCCCPSPVLPLSSAQWRHTLIKGCTPSTHGAGPTSLHASFAHPRLGSAAAVARTLARRPAVVSAAAPAAGVAALIFDCDGVIVLSEDIHRIAYNAAFANFDVRCPSGGGAHARVEWSVEFYDMLQNKVGGGKPKMRWFFGENGWPTSAVHGGRAPENEEERTQLIDTLQDWKTVKYKDIIGSGEVAARPGVLELMDEAKAAGAKVAVCSASTKDAALFVVQSLLGPRRFSALDLFLAGNDVPVLKPDPTIYRIAAERLGVSAEQSMVVEDSVVGLKAATGAGMRCVITYTGSTGGVEFPGAYAVLQNLGGVRFEDLATGALAARDDRAAAAAAAV